MANIQEMHDQAGAEYAAAVKEFRRTRARLAALDSIRSVSGFGPAPETISLRHSVYAADVSGFLPDDVRLHIGEINKTLN